MCGIIGYTGKKNARRVVLDGLKNLEYRGYDSAGIALGGDTLTVTKRSGRVSVLESAAPPSDSTVGIGHTRWATHGKAVEQNAHPHLSPNGKIAIVHNGIIENCKALKTELERDGVRFRSDTDTEIIAVLLQKALEENGSSVEKPQNAESRQNDENSLCACGFGEESTMEKLRAIQYAASKTEGAATFLAVFEGDNNVYCHRQGAALIVGYGDEGAYAASDRLALIGATRAAVLSDGETAVLFGNGKIEIYLDGQIAEKTFSPIDCVAPPCCKCHMKREIAQIPSALESTYLSFAKEFDLRCAESIAKSNRIAVFACGTAYHAGLYAKEVFEKISKIPTDVYVASEADGVGFLNERCFCVFISQSGETADTLSALRLAKSAGCQTLAVTNVRESTITFEADFSFYLDAGTEIAVAATKSYNCQMLAVYLIAHAAAKQKPDTVAVRQLIDACRTVTAKVNVAPDADKRKLFFIGKGIDKINALEGALKFKEITYRMTDAYPAGELKHGTIALIDCDSTVVVIATDGKNTERISTSVSELKARGAQVSAITAVGDIGAHYTLNLPPLTDSLLYPIVSVIPLQILSMETSFALGINPDKPRNLAKSVTVV